jgi:hypothetical protein
VSPYAYLGLGAFAGWLILPWTARLGRVTAVPAAWCRNLRAALLGSALLPLLIAAQPLLPAPARPRLPAALHIEAWVVSTSPPGAHEAPPVRVGVDGLFGAFGVLWLALSGFGLVRELVRALRARQLRATTLPAPGELQALCARLAAEYGVPAPELCIAPTLACAGTLGAFAPAILCPPADLALDPRAFELVLRHELCHVRRRDNAWRTLERLAQATLFGHPALASIERDLALAREAAVDREAAAGDTAAYAALLLTLAERHAPPEELGLVSSVGTAVERRLEMLFNPRNSSRNPRWLAVLGAIATSALLMPAAFADGPSKPFQRRLRLSPPEAHEPKVNPDVDACYAEARKQDARLVVDTRAELHVRPSGEVFEAHIPSSSKVFQACIEARALGWRFAPPPDAPPPPRDARLMVAFPIQRTPD